MLRKKISPEDEILTELTITGTRIGFSNEFLKIALIFPRDEIKTSLRGQYDWEVNNLKELEYKIISLQNRSTRTSKVRPVYHILQRL